MFNIQPSLDDDSRLSLARQVACQSLISIIERGCFPVFYEGAPKVEIFQKKIESAGSLENLDARDDSHLRGVIHATRSHPTNTPGNRVKKLIVCKTFFSRKRQI